MVSYLPRGREGIGVVQPRAGTDYPLVNPSADLRYLLADAYVECECLNIKFPCAIVWAAGLGTGPETMSSYWGSAVNAADLLIQDADGNTIIDTRESLADNDYPLRSFSVRDWGTRLKLYEWRTERWICRIVTHTAWSPDDDPLPQDYSADFSPEFAVLDSRVINQLPRRVTSIRVNGVAAQPGVALRGGYNAEVLPLAVKAAAVRRVAGMQIHLGPDDGRGRYRDCGPQPLVIRTINGVGPTDRGHFQWSASECYFVRESMRYDGGVILPAVAVSPGSILSGDLPDSLAGTSKSSAGWPVDDSRLYANLLMGNNCKPCSSCDDYVSVAEYMNSVRDDYAALGVRAAAIYDKYLENRERWLAATECSQQRPLHLQLQPQQCPYLDVMGQFVNQGDQCVFELALTFTFEAVPESAAGVQLLQHGQISGLPSINGTSIQRYTLAGDWPTYTARWPVVADGETVFVRFRLKFNDDGLGYVDGELLGDLVRCTITCQIASAPLQYLSGPLTGQAVSLTRTTSLACVAETL